MNPTFTPNYGQNDVTRTTLDQHEFIFVAISYNAYKREYTFFRNRLCYLFYVKMQPL